MRGVIHFRVSLRQQFSEIRRGRLVAYRRISGVDVAAEKAKKTGDEEEDGGREEGGIVVLEASICIGIQELRHDRDRGAANDFKIGVE